MKFRCAERVGWKFSRRRAAISPARRLMFRDNRKHKKSLGLTAPRAEGQIMMRKENNGLEQRALSKYRHLPTKSLCVINLNYVSFVALLILCLLTQSSPALICSGAARACELVDGLHP